MPSLVQSCGHFSGRSSFALETVFLCKLPALKYSGLIIFISVIRVSRLYYILVGASPTAFPGWLFESFSCAFWEICLANMAEKRHSVCQVVCRLLSSFSFPANSWRNHPPPPSGGIGGTVGGWVRRYRGHK